MSELAAILARRRKLNVAKGEVVSSGQGKGGPIETGIRWDDQPTNPRRW
jgi:hypothetical protein